MNIPTIQRVTFPYNIQRHHNIISSIHVPIHLWLHSRYIIIWWDVSVQCNIIIIRILLLFCVPTLLQLGRISLSRTPETISYIYLRITRELIILIAYIYTIRAICSHTIYIYYYIYFYIYTSYAYMHAYILLHAFILYIYIPTSIHYIKYMCARV